MEETEDRVRVMMNLNLTGQRFSRLVAVKPLRRRHRTTGAVMWNCACDCGKYATVPSTSLRSLHSKSCGCWHRDVAKAQINRNRPAHPRLKHGGTSDPTLIPTYRAYQSMLRRCYNPHAINYQFYGGAGVTVCDEWRESFENFLRDMHRRPEGTQLGRWLDVGQYRKENCSWQTPKQQQEERRRKRHFIKNTLDQALLIGPYSAKQRRRK